jgi:hypothetical protein
MAWNELVARRKRRSRTYQDSEDPRRHALDATLAALHYESTLDSGVYDAEVDFTPERVDTNVLDGWRVTRAGWQYALGTPKTNAPGDGRFENLDGTVGFGGRQGEHWLMFRLLRVGYVHWPTRDFTDIAGLATYDRANLTNEARTLELPLGDTINVESVARWTALWQTPGGGQVDISWQARGDGLKERIELNQAGRDWIRTNAPPTTPTSETYFTYLFELDPSDVPKWIKEGVQQDINGDFDDDNGMSIIEARNAADALLFLLPLDDAWVEDADGDRIPWVVGQDEYGDDVFAHSTRLRKRLYSENGRTFLAIGCRVDTLNGLPDGLLVFDPTIDDQVGADADDGYGSIDTFDNNGPNNYVGYSSKEYRAFHRFTNISGLSGSTIDVAYIELYRGQTTGSPETELFAEDAAAPTQISDEDDMYARTLTTASVTWDGAFSSGWNQSPSIVTVIQELADDYDPSAIQIHHRDDLGSGTAYNASVDYNSNSTQAAKLHIEYSTGVPVETVTATVTVTVTVTVVA